MKKQNKTKLQQVQTSLLPAKVEHKMDYISVLC